VRDLFGEAYRGADLSPRERAEFHYREGDRHPAGSRERREHYAWAAEATQEAERLERKRAQAAQYRGWRGGRGVAA
jgi:hypothetical protein